ncbi:MAG: iron-sulfur cluster assembly scaffold protein [Erythrobacter sp.]
MTARAAGKLYTPELLSLATELAAYPFGEGWPVTATARSRACGSHLTIGLDFDAGGRIGRFGLAVSACAVGQASAAIFARSAAGQSAASIASTLEAIERWLGDTDAALPGWPGFAALTPAREYPGRHGALMLPWKAAADALCKGEITS